jgi:hypothetical protein
MNNIFMYAYMYASLSLSFSLSLSRSLYLSLSLSLRACVHASFKAIFFVLYNVQMTTTGEIWKKRREGVGEDDGEGVSSLSPYFRVRSEVRAGTELGK